MDPLQSEPVGRELHKMTGIEVAREFLRLADIRDYAASGERQRIDANDHDINGCRQRLREHQDSAALYRYDAHAIIRASLPIFW